jgi:DNA-binding IclR family transcriptional regulator
LTLAEVSRRLSLPKSSTHLVLLTLERRGYIQRNKQTYRYTLSFKVFSLANDALLGMGLREQALPVLRELMARSQMVVHLALLSDDEALVIEKLEPPTAVRISTWIGKRWDLHASGIGKALIAYLPEPELTALFRYRGLPRYNENTITSMRGLQKEIERVRQLGYSFEDEEGEIGCRCIGAPLFDAFGNVIAAISVAGTTEQIPREAVPELGELVKNTAAAIQRRVLSIGRSPAGRIRSAAGDSDSKRAPGAPALPSLL